MSLKEFLNDALYCLHYEANDYILFVRPADGIPLKVPKSFLKENKMSKHIPAQDKKKKKKKKGK